MTLRTLTTSLLQACNLLSFFKLAYTYTHTFRRREEEEREKEAEKQGNEKVTKQKAPWGLLKCWRWWFVSVDCLHSIQAEYKNHLLLPCLVVILKPYWRQLEFPAAQDDSDNLPLKKSSMTWKHNNIRILL